MAIGEFLGGLAYAQYIARVEYPVTDDFKGKTLIVTGSNTGLGKEAVRHFVRLGASKVILACRTISKGEDAKADIVKTNPTAESAVEVWPLDLSSYDSVKAFAKKAQDLPRLDVLLENAGVATDKFTLTEGNESSITTNVISTYLLALLMLPKLKETAAKFGVKPHLTIVSSDVHYLPGLLVERNSDNIFDALSDPNTQSMKARYSTSKLLEVLASRQMVEEHMSSSTYPVIHNLMTPGFCESELGRDAGFTMVAMKVIFWARSTETGSRTLVHAAHAGPETHGKFLMDNQVKNPSAFVLSEDGQKTQVRVWKELSAKLENISPGILKNL